MNARNRKAIGDSIEKLINMLDAMSPDPDLEPWLGVGDDREGDMADWEPDSDTEANGDERDASYTTTGAVGGHWCEDVEEENEHGGNVTDEPHDAQDEGDYEPSLGWGNRTGQSGVGLEHWNGRDACDTSGNCPPSPLGWTGAGYAEGKAALRQLQHKRPDKPQAYVQTSAGLAMDWWKSGEVGDVPHLRIMPGVTRILRD